MTSDTRPTKRLPRIKATTYSVTHRREAMLEVTVEGEHVSIVMKDGAMTMSKNNARRLVAMLLERLG